MRSTKKKKINSLILREDKLLSDQQEKKLHVQHTFLLHFLAIFFFFHDHKVEISS